MKKVIYILAALWLVILLRLTLFRDGCFSHGLFSGRVEWDAFAYYLRLARVGRWHYFCYLFFGNLLWFTPVGLFTRIQGGRLWKAVFFGFLLSLFVETGQFVLGSGISELDDLILNSCGALLGYAAACVLLKNLKNKKSPIDKKPQDIDNRT